MNHKSGGNLRLGEKREREREREREHVFTHASKQKKISSFVIC